MKSSLPLVIGLVVCLCAAPSVHTQASAEPLGTPVKNARLEIFKGKRQLHLYAGDELVRTYPIGLGFEPVRDKTREGDGATPEGDYFVCVKNPKSQFYLSLGLNYPNAADAQRGLEAGQISKAEHRRIVDAEKRGIRPPWNTALGGEIFIHGRGAGSDWTLGCVALEDEAMKELYDAVSIGTPVRIKP